MSGRGREGGREGGIMREGRREVGSRREVWQGGTARDQAGLVTDDSSVT
jgi:hypothetical protein